MFVVYEPSIGCVDGDSTGFDDVRVWVKCLHVLCHRVPFQLLVLRKSERSSRVFKSGSKRQSLQAVEL